MRRGRATIGVVKRLVLLAMLVGLAGCASGPTDGNVRTAPSVTARASGDPAAPTGTLLPVGRGTRVFVGRLVENVQFASAAPLEYCLDDGERYLGAPHRLGTVNLVGKHDFTAKDVGLVVVAYGKERPLLDLLQPLGPCPTNYGDGQSGRHSSDQPGPEGGYRTRRSILQKLAFIDAEKAEVVKLHEVVQDDTTNVVVRLFNPFERPLKPEARARYEGSVAQPVFRSIPIGVALEPGGQLDVTLEKRIDHTVRGPYGDRAVRLLIESVELSLYRPEIRIEASLFLEVR